MNAPKDCTRPQLAKVGITLVRAIPLTLQCQKCGAEWRAERLHLWRTPYWRCRKGCNAPDHNPGTIVEHR
jgi:hypothetical protein